MEGGRRETGVTDDRFAFVRRDAGKISDSQKEAFDDDSFLDPLVVSAPAASSPSPVRPAAADDPILMCSLPDTPMPSPEEALGLGPADAPPAKKAKGKSPAKSPEAPPGEKVAARKLPASIQSNTEKEAAIASSKNNPLPKDFGLDVLMDFSRMGSSGAVAPKVLSPKRPPAETNPNVEVEQGNAADVTGEAASSVESRGEIEFLLKVIRDVQVSRKEAASKNPSPPVTDQTAAFEKGNAAPAAPAVTGRTKSSKLPAEKNDFVSIMGDLQYPAAQKAAASKDPAPEPSKKPANEEGSAAAAAQEPSSSGNPLPMLSLAEALAGFRPSSTRFENTDILDILAMKGYHFPNPSWWRKGGYDAKPKNTK